MLAASRWIGDGDARAVGAVSRTLAEAGRVYIDAARCQLLARAALTPGEWLATASLVEAQVCLLYTSPSPRDS